jgi:hypothetical protein
MTILDNIISAMKAMPGYPWTTIVLALGIVNAACLTIKAKAAPTSKIYHIANIILGIVANGLDIWNGIRGLFNKEPVVLGKPLPGDLQQQASNLADMKKTPLVLLALGFLAFSPGRAEAQWSVGPSVSMFRLGLGTQPATIQPGAGIQVNYRASDKLTLDLAGLGTVIANPAQSSPVTLSLAPLVSYAAGVGIKWCAGIIGDLLSTAGNGLFQHGRDYKASIGLVLGAGIDVTTLASIIEGIFGGAAQAEQAAQEPTPLILKPRSVDNHQNDP